MLIDLIYKLVQDENFFKIKILYVFPIEDDMKNIFLYKHNKKCKKSEKFVYWDLNLRSRIVCILTNFII